MHAAPFAILASLITLPASGIDSAYLDRVVPALMERHRVPGAVVVLVKDGAMVAARGYGVSRLDTRAPVDPEKTPFRVGSISKVFTATALLQLAEQGRLDLHQDVNSYLRAVRVPEAFGKPVTAADLLTHTAGFDERYHGASSRSDPGPEGLSEYIREMMPVRLVAPGEVHTYSNYGYGLAGYMVETITGKAFDRYMRENVLTPLGMEHSSFRPEGAMLAALAQGYDLSSGVPQPIPYDYLRAAPAGMLVASGADMGRFLLAHLENGRVSDQLHSLQFTHRAGLLNGYSYAFPITTRGGWTTLNHGGAYMGAIAQMWLIPENRAGFFIAGNVMSPSFTAELTDAIWKQFIPDRKSSALPAAALHAIEDTNLARFAGTYRSTRYAHSTFEKMDILGGMNAAELRISQAADGTLLMPDLSGTPQRMIQTAKGLFQRVDSDYRIAFRETQAGKVTHLFTTGIDAFERVPWYGERELHRMLTGFFLVTFVSVLVSWIFQRGRGDSLGELRIAERWMSALNLGYVAGLAIVMTVLVPRHELLSGCPYGLPRAIYAVQSIPYFGLALGGIAVWRNIALWKEPGVGWWSRCHHLGIAICGIGFIAFLGYWRHLGYKF